VYQDIFPLGCGCSSRYIRNLQPMNSIERYVFVK
jgi:hypothetical protein